MSAVDFATVDGDRVAVSGDTLDSFSSRLRGPLFRPGDPGYEESRTLYNATVDRRPAAIVRCSDVADVAHTVDFARDDGVLLAIRGGGHNGPGLALCDGGVVADMRQLDGIRVDPAARTARVGAGAVWGAVDHATGAFGMATPSGVISSTGVAGLTLGGGHGYLTRRHGLTIDNLLEADVVLADGTQVTASAHEHPDLFWAIRGGGGNFGVVTSFLYRLHAVDTVTAGAAFWDVERTPDLMRWYRGMLREAPADVYAFCSVNAIPPGPPFPEAIHGRRVCGLQWCCTGGEQQAHTYIGASHDLGEPLFEHIGPMPYPALQSAFDELYHEGLHWHWKGDFVGDLPDAAIDRHLEFARRIPTPLSLMHLYPIDGAVHDRDADATAWPWRDVRWSMVIAGVARNADELPAVRQWARDYWAALHPYTAGASYVNFMMEEGEERIRATYGDNHGRLATVKAAYDPHNLFRVNQNIAPRA